MKSCVITPYLLLFLLSITIEGAGQCAGGGIWNGGLPVAGTTDANGKLQGTVSVRAFTAATLSAGRPIYNSPTNTYGGFNYKALTVIRGASFGSGYTYFKLSTALGPTMIHLRLSDIRGDGFNTESQRVEGFKNGVAVSANFVDPVNGAFITGGNVINGPATTTNTVQAAMRVFFNDEVDSIKITRTGLSDFVIIDLFSRCDLLLPFTLSHFSATLRDNRVNVSWKTAEAYGFSHFNIERSANGQTWETIGTKNIGDVTGSPGDYEFVDNTPLQDRSFYRLTSVDFDGHITISAVASVLNKNKFTTKVKLSPNPFNQTLKIEKTDPQVFQYAIFSADGRKLAVFKNPQKHLTINTSGWESGIYFLELTDLNGNRELIRLIRQ
jgi:hypothetical protein